MFIESLVSERWLKPFAACRGTERNVATISVDSLACYWGEKYPDLADIRNSDIYIKNKNNEVD